MARDEETERRLQNWARWRLCCTGGPLGYAGVDLTTADQPSGGFENASIPTNDVEASETEVAVRALSADLKQTVELHYIGAGSQAKKATKLCITERTMRLRVEQARRQVSAWFAAKTEAACAERDRVVRLQRMQASR